MVKVVQNLVCIAREYDRNSFSFMILKKGTFETQHFFQILEKTT